MPVAMRYELASLSRQGGRPYNEDRVRTAEREGGVLMVVADGLGGHAGGEYASEILTRALIDAYAGLRSDRVPRPAEFLTTTLLEAHHRIRDFGRRRGLDPRTTCVACLVQGDSAVWVHVGDSRLYHLRAGRLLSRTRDHSRAEELYASGQISEDEMGTCAEHAVLRDCVGGREAPGLCVSDPVVLQPGDVLLLCSDGLWQAHPVSVLAAHLQDPDVEVALERLALAAEERFKCACDNVSGVLLRWLGADGDASHAGVAQTTTARPQLARADYTHASRRRDIAEMERFLKDLGNP